MHVCSDSDNSLSPLINQTINWSCLLATSQTASGGGKGDAMARGQSNRAQIYRAQLWRGLWPGNHGCLSFLAASTCFHNLSINNCIQHFDEVNGVSNPLPLCCYYISLYSGLEIRQGCKTPSPCLLVGEAMRQVTIGPRYAHARFLSHLTATFSRTLLRQHCRV